jgi:hypothetical protein
MALLGNLRLAQKNLPGTNTLAYFAAASATEKKSFMASTSDLKFNFD